MERFDALIIGGGPAGATAALLLAQAGCSVLVVERQTFPRRKVCGEYLSATNWPLLESLGIAEELADRSGPPVRETAVFVGSRIARAALPVATGSRPWGQALSREHLDTLLLERAARQGVQVIQPGRCGEIMNSAGEFHAQIETATPGQVLDVRSRVVIAAHGSWELGSLPTQRRPQFPRGADWLAFKAHFRETGLPPGLMPLVSFAGGYGGMVHVGGGRASHSCCIRRSWLARLPRTPGDAAGQTVLAHILNSCPALRPVLDGATLDGPWLAAGPIQPGIRRGYLGGHFVLGNAAGEAHPVVAEGISMAMQSAWLLARLLIPERSRLAEAKVRDAIGRAYSAAWRRAFAPRIRAAAGIAHWAERPRLVQLLLPALQARPDLLSLGARLSGKAKLVATA
jgi:flavin-dependent dehydrogenase